MITKLRFFIASSRELLDDRNLVELLALRCNRELVDQGLFLDIIRWEMLDQTFEPGGVQGRFSKEMMECDVVIFLFHTFVGRFTNEEFNTVLKTLLRQKSKNRQRVLAFFKKLTVTVDGTDRNPFRKATGIVKIRKLIEQAGQICNDYCVPSELEGRLKSQLKLLENDFREKYGHLSVKDMELDRMIKKFPPRLLKECGSVSIKELELIAQHCGWLTRFRVNPHLRPIRGDFSYWREARLTRLDYFAEFAARVLILERADKIKMDIPEQGDLSEKAAPLIMRLRRRLGGTD